MKQHLFPQWLWSKFSQQCSYHTGSWPGILEVRQIQPAKEILNDSSVTIFLPTFLPDPKPLASLTVGQDTSFASAPFFHTTASILCCSWPMACLMLLGPWNSSSSEALITQTSCADFKHTHKHQDRHSWSKKITQNTQTLSSNCPATS